MITRDEV